LLDQKGLHRLNKEEVINKFFIYINPKAVKPSPNESFLRGFLDLFFSYNYHLTKDIHGNFIVQVLKYDSDLLLDKFSLKDFFLKKANPR